MSRGEKWCEEMNPGYFINSYYKRKSFADWYRKKSYMDLMQKLLSDRVESITTFILANFGPLIGFYLANYFWGLKAAVSVSMVLAIAEFFLLRSKNKKISVFFYFSSAIVVLFGLADLIIEEPFFIKFEATLTNLFFAIFFGMSLFKEKSIVQEFAEAKNRTSEEQSEDKSYFFRLFTAVWCLYFVIKAVFYLWLNFNMSLNEGLILRMIIGKMSFWVMMFISIGLPAQVWKILEKFKLFPSQKAKMQISFLLQ